MKSKKLFKNYYDVVIIPPVRLRNSAIRLSRQVADRYDGAFKLGNSRFVPHISLYHIAVEPRRLSEFRETLKRIVKGVPFRSLRIIGIKQIKEKSVWMEISRPRWLLNLHREILKETFKFQDPAFPARRVWMEYDSAAAKRNIKRYGSPYVDRLFQPHITLTVLEQKVPDLKNIKTKKESFQVHSVSVYQLGPHHTCHKKIFTVYSKGNK